EDVNDYMARGFARSELADYEVKQRDGFLALRGQQFADRTAKAMREDWIKLPFLNTEFNADPDAAAWTRYRLSDDMGGFLDVVYGDLIRAVAHYRLLPGLAIVFLGLALISWLMHRPRKVWTRKVIHPGTAAAEAAEAATLQPLA